MFIEKKFGRMYLRGIDMNLTIRPLDPQHPEQLPNFFDSLDYSHAPHWSGCYCRYYHNEDGVHKDSNINRKEAIESISKCEMKGFLAFDQDKAVGWLNSQDIKQYKRLESVFNDYRVDEYALTICFVIHPDVRNQGVATQMLAYAIEYYKSLGYKGMLALPPKEVVEMQKTYRGPLSMYLKLGYKVVYEKDDYCLVRLEF